MHAAKRIAVAGATGRVGRHVVDVLGERGVEVVPMARSLGIDLVTGAGLDEAMAGVDVIIDAATGSSPDQQVATEFFTAATRNLLRAGQEAGVRRLVVVSIIGTDRFSGGYSAAKIAHEQAALAGPIPARVVRAAQFHEFVGQLMDWGRQGEVTFVPEMRTQLVAARAVAETLVDVALAPEAEWVAADPFLEVAGPREERLAEMARLLAERRGDATKVQEVKDPDDPDAGLYSGGALLPGPGAVLAGPTFPEWLATAA